MRLFIITTICLLYAGVNLHAQDDPSKAPREALAKLDGIVGNWSVTAHYYDQQQSKYVRQANSIMSIQPILKGLGLREKPIKVIDGETIGIEVTFGYDQYRNVYRLFVLDDSYGVPDVYEGNITDNKLVATNIGQGTDYPLQNGGKLEFRFSMELGGDSRLLMIDMTADAGKTWLPMYRYEYERIKD